MDLIRFRKDISVCGAGRVGRNGDKMAATMRVNQENCTLYFEPKYSADEMQYMEYNTPCTVCSISIKCIIVKYVVSSPNEFMSYLKMYSTYSKFCNL